MVKNEFIKFAENRSSILSINCTLIVPYRTSVRIVYARFALTDSTEFKFSNVKECDILLDVLFSELWLKCSINVSNQLLLYSVLEKNTRLQCVTQNLTTFGNSSSIKKT